MFENAQLSLFAAGRDFAPVILVVDDDDSARGGTAKLLRRAGFAVYTAGTGTEGLAIFTAAHSAIDLLVTDVQMPGMQGDQLVEQIRALTPGLPVVFVSGDRRFATLAEATPGPATFLEKPFLQTELLASVNAVWTSSRPTAGRA